MKIEEFNGVTGAPELPATLAEGTGAINGYIASLVMHAAKVERETNSSDNVFRWSINEEMEFRGAINTSANDVLASLAAAI